MSNATRLLILYGMIEDPGAECIIWPFRPNSSGYGHLDINGKRLLAHRLALMSVTGPPEPGMQAAHGPCHNRACVNPRHLSWKTYRDNQRDKIRDDTLRKKLTNDEVDAIRRTYQGGGVEQKELAARFGVSQSMISRIVTRRRWAHAA